MELAYPFVAEAQARAQLAVATGRGAVQAVVAGDYYGAQAGWQTLHQVLQRL